MITKSNSELSDSGPYHIQHPSTLQSYLYWITDQEIASSQSFSGWHQNYTAHPTWGIEDRDRNAYHCRYLAERMRERGEWIGEPVEWRWANQHKLHGGNHRVRAAQYLWETERLLVYVPLVVE